MVVDTDILAPGDLQAGVVCSETLTFPGTRLVARGENGVRCGCSLTGDFSGLVAGQLLNCDASKVKPVLLDVSKGFTVDGRDLPLLACQPGVAARGMLKVVVSPDSSSSDDSSGSLYPVA